jgi:hypothetical protein
VRDDTVVLLIHELCGLGGLAFSPYERHLYTANRTTPTGCAPAPRPPGWSARVPLSARGDVVA